ncbi:MarR family winged helix-turn-helix transcriptional regulator [Pseudonocardia sp. HH130630-07]|uniref:MarR family winged helix-turn-helix transcriptional regulator n=1 Tax=Pseudonocardia sp. HH130630-07 TaxID=1690815 RepID=UPI000814C9EA|nr:MarR family winged helix-turn-helix transcriptional regulator [Pseudonocardia sp. HH130630-07]ANY06849.1 transcriptional regulator [Pseudonocardia sp. HH130630-07]
MTPDGPGRALFAFVRHWSRRAPDGDDPIAARGRHALVAEAVAALTRRDVVATVNAIAAEIGLDQSGASRLVRDAAAAGYLTVGPVPGDARSRCTALTGAGGRMLADAHAWQEQVFDRLTDGWSAQRRAEFERGLRELVERSTLAGPGEPGPPS